MRLTLLFALPALLAGCGGKTEQTVPKDVQQRISYRGEMKQLAVALYKFHEEKGRAPNDAAELIAARPDLPPEVAKKLTSGEFEVVWGYKPGGPSDQVVAWSKADLFGGGVCVVYADGGVVELGADQFAAAKKAAPAK